MTLRLDKDGKIARLVIDRPDKRNAFNQEMWDFFPTLLAECRPAKAPSAERTPRIKVPANTRQG